MRLARDEAERALLWKARKRAFGAVGRLAPNYATQDGVVPRTRLPDILRVITMLSRRYRLAIGNVFHAGDGNIHPIVLYDERDPDQVRRAIEAGREILKACVEMGGSLTGEHGIGVEKIGEMPLMFSPDDLIVMSELRRVFDPDERRQSQQGHSATRRLRRSRRAAPPGPAVTGRADAASDKFENAIRRLLGAERVRAPRASEVPAARLIVEPRDSDEVAALVRKCEARPRYARAVRRRAHARGKSAARPSMLGVSLARMNRIVAYEPDDMTVIAEAGMTLGALNQRLAEHRPAPAARSARPRRNHARRADWRGPRRPAAGFPRARRATC